MAEARRYETLAEFWPYYLSDHLHPVNRALHVVGSLGGLAWLGLAIAWRQPWLVLAGLVNGYAFAWVGHFVIERNRPATFQYPLKSFLCDWVLLACVLTGRIGREVERLREGRIVEEEGKNTTENIKKQ
jgi:hypothetical protein